MVAPQPATVTTLPGFDFSVSPGLGRHVGDTSAFSVTPDSK